MRKIQWVAHRGYSYQYPENSLLAMRKAIDAGAKFVELDVQLTRDLVPVMLHDELLERTTNGTGLVYEQSWDELRGLNAAESSRLGDKYTDEPLPRLDQLSELLAQHPDVTAFVELKDESIDVFGVEVFVKQVLQAMSAVMHQVVIISYNTGVLVETRRQGKKEIGWVVTHYNEDEHQQANRLLPNYIISNYKKINTGLWQGPWQWFVYEVTDLAIAKTWFDRGVDYIETMQVVEMIEQQKQAKA